MEASNWTSYNACVTKCDEHVTNSKSSSHYQVSNNQQDRHILWRSHTILKKVFFMSAASLLCLRRSSTVPPLFHYCPSEGTAKEERRKSEPTPNPPWGGAISAYLELLPFFIVNNIYKACCLRLERISKASRRHLEHMPKETARRTFNMATVNV